MQSKENQGQRSQRTLGPPQVTAIQCSEGKPQCNNCLKHAMQCVYPDKQASTPPTQINLIQPNPLGYSLRDMRFFHDFLTTSYPHLPLESDDAWLNEIPIIAQQVWHLDSAKTSADNGLARVPHARGTGSRSGASSCAHQSRTERDR